MARTIDDLILLDSVVRQPDMTTTAHGMISEAVTCDAVISNISLNGTRIGLPSTFGWETGLSGEVRPNMFVSWKLVNCVNSVGL